MFASLKNKRKKKERQAEIIVRIVESAGMTAIQLIYLKCLEICIIEFRYIQQKEKTLIKVAPLSFVAYQVDRWKDRLTCRYINI